MFLFQHIREVPDRSFVGVSASFTLQENNTPLLWQTLMPKAKFLTTRKGVERYAIQQYFEALEHFTPTATFIQWAALEVEPGTNLPDGLQSIQIPAGTYAVYLYRGDGTDFGSRYPHLLFSELPAMGYRPANRPHFQVMGPNYQPFQANSEEEVFIPVEKIDPS